MEITNELRELAKFVAGSLPVVSVYLNTQWRDQHQRERASTFFTRHIRQAQSLTIESEAARASLENDLARIEDWGQRLVRGTVDISTPGCALFTCHGADLWVELPSPIAFDDEFIIASHPALRQLARLDENYTNALVVLVDSHIARVCEVVLGGFLSETEFTRDFPGRHKQGGWAQMRYQRHVKDHMDRHHKEVADYLTSCLTERPQTRLILSGQPEILANFRHFLAPQVEQQIIADMRLGIRESPAQILEAAQEVLQRYEREEEEETVQLLLNRAGRGGLAVVGVQETLAAINTGRVHKLIVQRDFHHPGWRCLECGVLGEQDPPLCPVCGGKVETVDLGEALVNGVLRTDGYVEVIESDERLAAYEGVGALLRYK
jgi:peptide subunit release factor 1 (eRF1)